MEDRGWGKGFVGVLAFAGLSLATVLYGLPGVVDHFSHRDYYLSAHASNKQAYQLMARPKSSHSVAGDRNGVESSLCGGLGGGEYLEVIE